MTPQEIIDNLTDMPMGQIREELMRAAAQSSDVVDLLMQRARATMADSPADALTAISLGAEIARFLKDGRSGAAVHRLHAQTLRMLGRHEEALLAIDAAAAAARRAGDTLLAAQVQVGRIDSLGWLGRYDEAIAFAKRLKKEMDDAGSELDAAKVMANLANLLFRRDEFKQALKWYEAAAEMLTRLGDSVSAARVNANAANILTHLNRTDDALSLYEGARETVSSAGLTHEAAMIDGNIGFLHHVAGRYSSAVSAFMRARAEFAARGQDIETAKANLDLADSYRALNLLPEAAECYELARPVFDAAQIAYEGAKCELGLAAAILSQDRLDDGLSALDKAGELFHQQQNRIQSAHVQLIKSEALRTAGRELESVREASSAEKEFRRERMAGWAAEARFIQLDMALNEGDSTAVRRMLLVRNVARKHARGWLESRAERAVGLYHARGGNHSRAISHLSAGVAALETTRTLIAPEEMHVSFVRNKLSVYEELVSALLERGRPSDLPHALTVIERSKSRLLLERVQAAVDTSAARPTSDAMERRLAAVRNELSLAYRRLNIFDEQDKQRLAGGASLAEVFPLERDYQAALREAEVRKHEQSVTGVPVTNTFTHVTQLSDCLQPDEALLEYYVTGSEVCAFLVQPDGLKLNRYLANIEEVNHAARRLRYHLQRAELTLDYSNRHGEQLRTAAEQVLSTLYDLLLRPLSGLLSSEKLVIVPHGSLHGLPFHAFLDKDDGQFAVDRWEILYAPSATVWRHGAVRRLNEVKPSARPVKTLLMGMPSPGIEEVAREVHELKNLLPDTRAFISEEATLEAFRSNAGCCGRIHLATHALFRADNPLFSGLRLADGWLLARDLYEMRLDCDLATLSACRTGVSAVEPGDELFGLLRGFLAAGVRSVAASLWPADDNATTQIMIQFYSRLAANQSCAAALRSAQRHVRQQFPHPYHWAAFALIGER